MPGPLDEQVRACLDAHWSALIAFKNQCGADKELADAIQSAIDGNCDSLSEIGALVTQREAEADTRPDETLYWLNQSEAHGDKVA